MRENTTFLITKTTIQHVSTSCLINRSLTNIFYQYGIIGAIGYNGGYPKRHLLEKICIA